MVNERVVKTFIDLASISSPSKHEDQVRDYIVQKLQAYGLNVIEDDTATKIQGTSGNLICTIEGKQDLHILFDAHMDTVDPCEKVTVVQDGNYLRSDGTSVLGGDDKAGVAVMLECIDTIMAMETYNGPTLTFVFSVCEENSLQGVKNLDEKYIQDVDYAFVLDGEEHVEWVVNQTPYGCKGDLIIHGKEAHSGVCPENGINALYVAAQAIVQCPNGRVDEETTCNMGVVSGGKAKNVVMPDVKIEFESRSLNLDKLNALVEQIETTFDATAKQYGATFENTLKYGTPGYTLEKDTEIVQYLDAAMKQCDLKMELVKCGGGSNANIYHMKKVPALNIGVGAYDVHSKQEHLDMRELIKLSHVVKKLAQI